MRLLTKLGGVGIVALALTVHAAEPEPERAPQLAPAELKERAAKLRAQVKANARRIRHLQEVARREQDIVKLTCVNDKLVELKPNVNMFDAADQAFQLALDDEADGVRALFDQAVELSGAVKQLVTDAEACIGVPELYKDSKTEVNRPELPDDPTSPFEGQLEAPAYASPFC